jgi:hypothetical protein
VGFCLPGKCVGKAGEWFYLPGTVFGKGGGGLFSSSIRPAAVRAEVNAARAAMLSRASTLIFLNLWVFLNHPAFEFCRQ